MALNEHPSFLSITMKVLAILCLVALVSPEQPNIRQRWKEFKLKYHRSNGGSLKNEQARFRLFKKSLATINYINRLQADWKAGVTQFADMTQSEIEAYNGIKLNDTDVLKTPYLTAPLDSSDPAKKYWDMGPVKNQWSCGSCWAFAAVGAMEGRHLKEHGEYRDFSEQTLLDCTFEGWRDGCTGGWTDSAIKWAGSNSPVSGSDYYGYLPLRSDNKYTGKDRECGDLKTPYTNALRRAKPHSYSAGYKTRNDAGLQHALATEGPVVVYIYSSWALPFYLTGTYRGTGCGTNPTPNHAVVTAGYEKDYWYVKNSWGTSWGYSGYAYFSRGWENLCSISSSRKVIEWRPNSKWDQCADTHPSEKTGCDGQVRLDEAACLARGCCYDDTYHGSDPHSTLLRCFLKGKITIYDEEGKSRVLYGSANEFSQFEFSYYGKSVEVESGMWNVYVKADYYAPAGYKSVTAADGKFNYDFQSVKIVKS